MSTLEKIRKKIQKLPESSLRKVLEFVEGLNDEKEIDEKWKDFSLSQAMSGMESEDTPVYTEADLKERWN